MEERKISDKDIARKIISDSLFHTDNIEAMVLAKMVNEDDEYLEAQLEQYIEIFQNALKELKGEE